MSKKNLVGNLLVANPLNPKDGLDHSVILVVSHSNTASIGLQLNNPVKDLPLSNIFLQTGLWYETDALVHHGGNMNPGKIHMVHSLDWRGLSTVELAPNLGLTNDIGVLSAISQGEGPEHFRACAGFWFWDEGSLEEQLDLKSNAAHRWELAPASIDTVFGADELDQWHKSIEASARDQVNRWFNLFQG